MSEEPEEKRGILGRVKDVFFEAPPAPEPPPEEDRPAEAAAPSTAPSSPIDVAGAADFDAAYAQIAGTGDPKTDQILAAFADMSSKGLDGQPLATAMTAMINAFGADAKDIAVTIGKRMEAIGSAVAAQRSAMQGRISEMSTRTATVVAAAEEEIGELEERIKNLRGQVAEAQATVQKADASEQAAFTAFEQQASRKTGELHGFAAFLNDATVAS